MRTRLSQKRAVANWRKKQADKGIYYRQFYASDDEWKVLFAMRQAFKTMDLKSVYAIDVEGDVITLLRENNNTEKNDVDSEKSVDIKK